jgi:hypothetical protein
LEIVITRWDRGFSVNRALDNNVANAAAEHREQPADELQFFRLRTKSSLQRNVMSLKLPHRTDPAKR